jgi:nucleotide-binding universal stress UspA family protein
MTRFLLATDSVHTSAAACDYLQGRAGPADTVSVLAVRDAESERDTAAGTRDAGRDAADAANVAAVRLLEPEVETVERAGEPAAEILACAESVGSDKVLVGPHGDPPGAERLGETAQAVLARADLPVVVVPLA